MARPAVVATADDLYEALGPLTAGDEEGGWQLLLFCDALCRVCVQQTYTYVGDRDEYPGWVVVFDPDNAPSEVLPYLAQFAGVTLEPGLPEDEQRIKISTPEGFARGTVAAMVAAVRRTLTGAQTVILEERLGGNAYQLWVRTLAAETPDEAATLAAVLSQKPIGIVLTYEAVDGQTWADVETKHATWAVVESTYPTWNEAKATAP